MTQWKINFSVRRQRVTGSAVGRIVETLAFHHSNHLGEHCARLLLTLRILRSLRIRWFLPQKGVPKTKGQCCHHRVVFLLEPDISLGFPNKEGNPSKKQSSGLICSNQFGYNSASHSGVFSNREVEEQLKSSVHHFGIKLSIPR